MPRLSASTSYLFCLLPRLCSVPFFLQFSEASALLSSRSANNALMHCCVCCCCPQLQKLQKLNRCSQIYRRGLGVRSVLIACPPAQPRYICIRSGIYIRTRKRKSYSSESPTWSPGNSGRDECCRSFLLPYFVDPSPSYLVIVDADGSPLVNIWLWINFFARLCTGLPSIEQGLRDRVGCVDVLLSWQAGFVLLCCSSQLQIWKFEYWELVEGCSQRGRSARKAGWYPPTGPVTRLTYLQHFTGSWVIMATMNFPKIGAQGYSLGSLHLTSEEFVWTSADKSRYERGRLPLLWYDHSYSIPRCEVGNVNKISPFSISPSLPPDGCDTAASWHVRVLMCSMLFLAGRTSSKKVKWADVSHATWAQFGDYCHLRFFMKNDVPPVRLDGFGKAQHPGTRICCCSARVWYTAIKPMHVDVSLSCHVHKNVRRAYSTGVKLPDIGTSQDKECNMKCNMNCLV